MSRIGLGRHGQIDDNAGDPLDGLVNLFDIGIVLAVAFLIAGLTLTVNPDSGQVERRAGAAARRKVQVLPTAAAPGRPSGRGDAGRHRLPPRRRPPRDRRAALSGLSRGAGRRRSLRGRRAGRRRKAGGCRGCSGRRR